MSIFTDFRIVFGNFLICFPKFDWTSGTHYSFLEFVAKSRKIHQNSQKKCKIRRRKWKTEIHYSFAKKCWRFLAEISRDLSGAKVCKSCSRSRQELSNEYLLAKIGVDTAENEPLKVGRPPPIRTLKFFHIRQSSCTEAARSRLYGQLRWRAKTHFAALFTI